jgi:cellobiose transport system permease protein
MYMFENGFAPNFNFGYGSAVAWMLFLLIVVIAMINVVIIHRFGNNRRGGQ